MSKWTKKLLAVVLVTLLLCGIAPITASAAAPVGPSPIATWDFTSVDSNGSGSYGAGSWSWVQSTKTLTLTNLTHSTANAYAMILPAGVTIVLNGTNAITSTYNGSLTSKAIAADGNLTITGNGSLNVTAGSTTSLLSYGIVVGGCLTITNCTVVSKGSSSNCSVPGNERYSNSYGIVVYESLTIDNATVTATGGTAVNSSYGIFPCLAGSLTIKDSTVTATGSAADYSYGICAEDYLFTATNSTVNATGGTANNSYGILAGDTTIIGGTLRATGGTASSTAESSGWSTGLNATSLTVESGDVIAIGGTAKNDFSASFGIFAGEGFTVSGGTVNASGGTANLFSQGISTNEESIISISGGDVTATGGTRGIYTGKLVVSGGNLTATANTATADYGILVSYMNFGMDCLTISGGTVTAIGTFCAISMNYEVPNGYKYWTNASPSATGASGPFTGNGSASTVINSGHKYAKIEVPTTTNYTITYNANGGSVSPASATVNVGSSVTTPTPTKSYTLSYNVNGGNAVSPTSKSVPCTCNGWFTAASGGTKRANAGAAYTPTLTETIYAQWTNPAMGTLPTPTHPTSGYTFKGWFTAASGGTQVASSTTMTANQTIYAQWNAPTNIYTFGKDTYSFANYGDSDSAGGHCFGMSSTSSMYYLRLLNIANIGGNYTQGLYALSATATVKAPICYYQARQGSPALTATVAGGSYYKTGVSNINSDWTAVVNYVKGHAYDDKGTLQIGYRRESQGGHAINFLRYAEVGGDPRIYVYDNNFPNTETYLYKDASGFVRQAPNATFSGPIDCIALRNISTYYSVVGGFDMTHVIYADRDAIIVEGATVYPMDGGVELGEHVMFEIPPQLNQVTIIPLIDNAAFKYFDDAYSFGAINDDTIGIFTLASSGEGSVAGLTIRQRQNYTVILNPNGGSVSPTSITVTTGGTYSALPTPTRANYTFDGWYTAASGGSKVNKTDTVNLTGNTTLYAHWTAASQPVKKIFSTKYDATPLNWILFFVCFGWIWMWF